MERTVPPGGGLLRGSRPTFGRKVVATPTPPAEPAVEPVVEPENPYAETIAAVIEEARREIGYDRPNFIRVEHPDVTAPGSIMGRFRMHVPEIDPRLR